MRPPRKLRESGDKTSAAVVRLLAENNDILGPEYWEYSAKQTEK
jgi:hypothetical protein